MYLIKIWRVFMSSYMLYRFTASWCGPCKTMGPVVDKVITEFPDVQVKVIDVDIETDLSTQYRVRSIPTCILLKDDQVVGQFVGAASADKFREFITQNT